MALPPSFLEELRLRTPLVALIGRRVRLTRSGAQHKGCCPFHGEKTPSFTVYDDNFHCYGCGAHGDAISFVMQSEGTTFLEAVERLAGEAGLSVPAPSPQAAQAEQRRLDLYGVLDHAQTLFAEALTRPEGAAGLAYLRGRGLSAETIARAGLGWSGARHAVLSRLREAGVQTELAIAAGLAQSGEDGSVRAFFFERVTFPIRDGRGRIISFGGRILGDGQPKYLNGPETDIFSKRRSLYGLERARPACRAGAPVVVVEGYMDVIRLQQAGFEAAVAPLGTALSVEQLEALWQLSPAPVLCFDGDAAGARAAGRTLELALPLLSPERTLRVGALAAGEDPDSLVAAGGPGALQAVLDAARPVAEALFAQLRSGSAETPEGRAQLRVRLEAAAARVKHPALAREYRSALLDQFFAGRSKLNKTRVRMAPQRPRPLPTTRERGRNLTAILLHHPDLLNDVEEAFAAVELAPGLDRLRAAMRRWAGDHGQNAEGPLESAALMAHLDQAGLAAEAAAALSAVPLPACADGQAMPAEAEAHWWHIFGLLDRGGLEAQIVAATTALARDCTPITQRRLIALCAARDALRASDGSVDGPAGTEQEMPP